MKKEALHLLMASADVHRPFLEKGLPPEATWNAPKPKPLPRRTEVPLLEKPGAAPNDLPEQRWGVAAPEGELGDAVLRALSPLIQHREREQKAPVTIYRVPPDMDATAVVRWRDEVYRAEDVPREERPKYLLLLGDLHQVSIEFQHVLAHSAFVGRLHFSHPSGAPDLEGHAAYARKVLAFEQDAAASQAPDVLLYTAGDGSEATEWGRLLLVEPCQELIEKSWMRQYPGMGFHALSGDQAETEELLRVAGSARAGVMFSVSHGLGRPERGWASAEEQRAWQGALVLSPQEVLTADMLRSTPFLPGGMWFCLACFGAATPARSAFTPWLSQLTGQPLHAQQLEPVLKSLPEAGERPFVAALPQAALANPRGPLAVIGQSDLAWMYGVIGPDPVYRSRASCIASVLKGMVARDRAGVALEELTRSYREANETLMGDYQARQDALVDELPDPIEPRQHGYRWMLRNDLRGYILLGDPAVRLSLRLNQG
jgi:hypothetical protein